jgi:dihydrofolate reductase
MRKIIVVTNVILDGVIRASGRPDEDVRGGFGQDGWALPHHAALIASEMARGMGRTELLLGRRTYEDFYSYWQGGGSRGRGSPSTVQVAVSRA